MSGSIPDLSALTSLNTLLLTNNELSGSIVAARLPASLFWLYLDGNELSGSVPDLSKLTALRGLRLHNNELSGSIPATLGDLSTLWFVHLAGNGFTGGIPSDLEDLTELTGLSLCETDLDSTATLPAALETRRTGTSATLTVWSCVTLTQDASAPEGASVAFPVRHSTFPVRGTPGATSVDVSWSTVDGTATSEDYQGTPEDNPGSVTIPANTDTAAWTSTATISVPTYLDGLGLEEGVETFTLRIAGVSDNVLSIRNNATGTITPEPPPPPPPPSGGGTPPPPDPAPEPPPEPPPPPVPPIASFSVDVECADGLCRALTGQDVTFTDTSSGTVERRSWDFYVPGKSPTGATVRNAWSAPGFYEVTLAVSGADHESEASRVFLVEAADPAGSCEADGETICLQGSRYQVRATWRTPDGEPLPARAAHAGTNDSGLLWFHDAENREALVKILDGCAINGADWVFAASATTLGLDIAVTDTVTGEVREYENEPGRPALAITDTNAFTDRCANRGTAAVSSTASGAGNPAAMALRR